jgi:hypothetical protein
MKTVHRGSLFASFLSMFVLLLQFTARLGGRANS